MYLCHSSHIPFHTWLSLSDKHSSHSFSRAFMETSIQALCNAFETHSATKCFPSLADCSSSSSCAQNLVVLASSLQPVCFILDMISSRSLSKFRFLSVPASQMKEKPPVADFIFEWQTRVQQGMGVMLKHTGYIPQHTVSSDAQPATSPSLIPTSSLWFTRRR